MILNKRKNPDYIQVCGYVPVTLQRQFKSIQALDDIDQSEAMEDALRLWMTVRDVKEQGGTIEEAIRLWDLQKQGTALAEAS